MSFYDLTKDGVLRPEELFKYRLKRDCTIPSKGGQKDFEPDGSWLQGKRLETFLEERTTILSEPRVEKLKNMVEGVWNEEKRLVNLKKAGKFWMHMGFTDERRNWLYPEEALFLMETNTLELYHGERPMSIQEAYSKLLSHGVCLEEYQVFAHLRRLGYVVLRHEEERLFTDYELQINLNEYIDKKKRKERLMKGKGKSNKKISHSNAAESDDTTEKDLNTISANGDLTEHDAETDLKPGGPSLSGEKGDNLNGNEDQLNDSSPLRSKRNHEEDIKSEDNGVKRLKPENEMSEKTSDGSESTSPVSDDMVTSFYNVSSWSSCFKDVKNDNGSKNLNQTFIDANCIDLFPDLARSRTSLKSPPSNLLPSNVEISDLEFDPSMECVKYSTFCSSNEDHKEKRFSCLDRMNKEPKIKADSWSEYKRKKAERREDMKATTLVDHLWRDAVTPLMHPAEITSYRDVIDRLQIIQSADNEVLEPDASVLPSLPKVSFDVHLPDHRFKKSMPGVPDHRVCVTRCDGIPPGLTAVQYLWSKYKDGVPLHWAVVDSGEIAFYVFDNSKHLEDLNVV